MSKPTKTSRVPSLVDCCTRIAMKHAENMEDFGDNVRFEVVKPLLECCSPDLLARVEDASPNIKEDTSPLWEALCFRQYPVFMKEYDIETTGQPPSWREMYYHFKSERAARLKEVSSKIRLQRLEAEERKKDCQVKVTDRLPPMKRSRTNGWGQPQQPKTLFQKTRSEASRLQKNMYSARRSLPARARPPQVTAASIPDSHPRVGLASTSSSLHLNTSKRPRTEPTSLPSSASSPPSTCYPPSSSSSSLSVTASSSARISSSTSQTHTVTTGVTVRTVALRRPSVASQPTASSLSTSQHQEKRTPNSLKPVAGVPATPPRTPRNIHSTEIPDLSTSAFNRTPSSCLGEHDKGIGLATSPGNPGRDGSKASGKKDPLASLFMPKHKAFSQCSRPVRS